ncbi:MAG: hypothetical protein ACT4OX_10830 [Actinomycetota bacterium]
MSPLTASGRKADVTGAALPDHDERPARVSAPSNVALSRWLTAFLAVAFTFVLLFGSVLVLLYAGPAVNDGRHAEHSALRSHLVKTFSSSGEGLAFLTRPGYRIFATSIDSSISRP